ncbi:hypothetical protein L1987_78273 [Smallanthus sonchifolius]|uniref:Uncharacterized protein n=1 Tax=Smallanthus sonchifolius TaxID=185202 RepID=A0ACB8ZCD9_9ASTR|nr:hypothetical protein L1987_78273 [Smallanthus sonchifolius]
MPVNHSELVAQCQMVLVLICVGDRDVGEFMGGVTGALMMDPVWMWRWGSLAECDDEDEEERFLSHESRWQEEDDGIANEEEGLELVLEHVRSRSHAPAILNSSFRRRLAEQVLEPKIFLQKTK